MSEPTVDLLAPRTIRLVRWFAATPSRVFRCLSDPEELARWYPERIEGSLAAGTRSILVFADERTWWDVTVVDREHRFAFRWPWLPDQSVQTTVDIELEPVGYGTQLTLTDGPFDLRVPGMLDAFEQAAVGWGEALAFLRGFVDFTVELRPRRYLG